MTYESLSLNDSQESMCKMHPRAFNGEDDIMMEDARKLRLTCGMKIAARGRQKGIIIPLKDFFSPPRFIREP